MHSVNVCSLYSLVYDEVYENIWNCIDVSSGCVIPVNVLYVFFHMYEYTKLLCVKKNQ